MKKQKIYTGEYEKLYKVFTRRRGVARKNKEFAIYGIKIKTACKQDTADKNS